MSQVFPKSNLPASSQPWGRAIQDKLESLEKQTALQGLNLTSGDAQIQASYNRLDETVTEIEKLSDPDSKYSVDVNNLTGELFTSNGGINIKVVDQAERLSYPDLVVGKITTEESAFAFGSAIVEIDGNFVGRPFYQTFFRLVIDGRTRYTGYIPTSIIDECVKIKPGLIVDGTGGIIWSNASGGGTTGASINGIGQIVRTTSSERYKQDIEPLEVDYDDLLSLQPKRFKFKNEASEDENARYYAGFIAEEVAETSLTDFVAYTKDEEGNKIPDGVYYAELSAALLTAIKHQDELIKSLTNRVKALEDKV